VQNERARAEAKEQVGVRLAKAQIEGHKGPFIARGECRLATYYDFAFIQSAETHYSVELLQDDPRGIIYAYTPKDSTDGKKLFELLRDGRRRRMTFECEFAGSYTVGTLLRVMSFD